MQVSRSQAGLIVAGSLLLDGAMYAVLRNRLRWPVLPSTLPTVGALALMLASAALRPKSPEEKVRVAVERDFAYNIIPETNHVKVELICLRGRQDSFHFSFALGEVAALSISDLRGLFLTAESERQELDRLVDFALYEIDPSLTMPINKSLLNSDVQDRQVVMATLFMRRREVFFQVDLRAADLQSAESLEAITRWEHRRFGGSDQSDLVDWRLDELLQPFSSAGYLGTVHFGQDGDITAVEVRGHDKQLSLSLLELSRMTQREFALKMAQTFELALSAEHFLSEAQRDQLGEWKGSRAGPVERARERFKRFLEPFGGGDRIPYGFIFNDANTELVAFRVVYGDKSVDIDVADLPTMTDHDFRRFMWTNFGLLPRS